MLLLVSWGQPVRQYLGLSFRLDEGVPRVRPFIKVFGAVPCAVTLTVRAQ